MPDRSQKTEKPTPKRLEKAKEEGQAARSQDLNIAFTLMTSFLVLYSLFGSMFRSLGSKMEVFLSLGVLPDITKDSFHAIMTELFIYIFQLVSPVLLASAAIGIFISFVQVGPRFTPKLIKPQISRINPIEGAKRLFSLKVLIELFKSLAKAIVIFLLAYNQLRKSWHELINLNERGLEPALLYVAGLIFRIAVSIIIFLVILGIGDYIYQRWDYQQNLKMTKQEVKDEFKSMEGDPQIKGKRRQMHRRISLNRMIRAVQEADVVITNPTQIAVALKYDIDTMDAPVVVAKGEGFIAEKIKEAAREFNIEIVENKPLARALNALTEVGDEIPPELYQAVAEVLAYVYQHSGKKVR